MKRRPGLTIEAAAWVTIALVALVMRAANLEAAPLAQPEAREALAAWRATAVTLETDPVDSRAQPRSPTLLLINALTFALLGATDASARIAPALFGTALATSPWLLRNQIGRTGSAAAALYLAISPTALVASRQTNGAVLAAFGAIVALGGVVRAIETTRHRWMVIAAAGLALSLSSSALAYTTLIPLALAGGLSAWRRRAAQSSITLREAVRQDVARKGVLAFAVAMLVVPTGFGWYRLGLSRTGMLLLDWLREFAALRPEATAPAAIVFLAYECVLLLGGVGGLVWGMRHRRPLVRVLGIWAGAGLVMLWGRSGAGPLEGLAVVLPLALLAGCGTQAIIGRLSRRDARGGVRLIIPASMVIWAYTYIVLANYAKTGRSAGLLLALLAAGIQLLLAITSAFIGRSHAALAGLGAASAIILGLATLSWGWGAAHLHPSRPETILTEQPTDLAVRDLLACLEDISWQRTGVPRSLTLTYEARPDSVIAWYLREYRSARRIDPGSAALESPVEPGAVLITASSDLPLSDSARSLGQDFTIRRWWHLSEIACLQGDGPTDCSNAARWLIFRTTRRLAQPADQVVLWLYEADTRVDLAAPRAQ